MKAYAHTKPGNSDPSSWEPLFTPIGTGNEECQRENCLHCREMEPNHGHLNKVAYWAATFASQMFTTGSPQATAAWEWGYRAGLWHDLGKFAPEWQRYLAAKSGDPHQDEIVGKMDHATAGAVFANRIQTWGKFMAYLISGHHSGLADGAKLFKERLPKLLPDWEPTAKITGLLENSVLPALPVSRNDMEWPDFAFLMRFIFSCLVDADFMLTEAFMQPEQAKARSTSETGLMPQMLVALENHLTEKFTTSCGLVNDARAQVRHACDAAAELPTGFFSLTVPTGGGKTLSSLSFALRHAVKHGLRRVIYVIPYTSIIQQNADVFREAFASLSVELGRDIVLEHHSKFDPDRETEHTRLASENWDAPLIVTTNVQFFESLYANRTRACRKLHRIARSVIIFDEVQSLPMGFLAPILRGMRSLVKDLGATVLLCTATQPALARREGFHVGIPPEEIREIMPDREQLFAALKRVESHTLGKISDDELLDHVLKNAADGCLIIVNTTRCAAILHQKLSTETNALHLSARMCPAHVLSVLKRAKQLRKDGEPVVVVSTQLIEAGVDISFPVVYRAECGLDSFAQAAGRCNRNGELQNGAGAPICGRVYLFQPTEHPIPRGLVELANGASITRTGILPIFKPEELLSLAAVESYFQLAIWDAGPTTGNWDKEEIISGDQPCFSKGSTAASVFAYAEAAARFQLIPKATRPVIIPWSVAGEEVVAELKNRDRLKIPPNRKLYRQAQQFTVQVYPQEWEKLQSKVDLLFDGAMRVLIHPENDYSELTGLKGDSLPDDPSAFLM